MVGGRQLQSTLTACRHMSTVQTLDSEVLYSTDSQYVHPSTSSTSACQSVSSVASRQHLRSASRGLLVVPRHRLSSYGPWAFSVAGPAIYTVFQKSDAKIQITITKAYLIRIKYPLSGFNYHFSDVNVANFNKIHHTVSEQQLF